MPRRVYLIRHGSTELSAEDRFAGAIDVNLSDEGRNQARLLGERLAGEAITAFYASPMRRTVDTARLIAAPHGKEVTKVDDLREIAHGRWEGKTRADVEAAFPNEDHRHEHDPFTTAPEGREGGLDVTARAVPALLQLLESHDAARLAVVSHHTTSPPLLPT